MDSITPPNRETAAPEARLPFQRFEAQAARTPEAIALIHDGARWTFGELNARANQLAHRLIGEGVGPETLIAVCMQRGVDLIAALLATQKAGGAYVPIDPAYPAERMSTTLEDARAPLILTQSPLEPSLPVGSARALCVDRLHDALAGEPSSNPNRPTRSDQLAYVLFTSGSTGRPKGVAIGHRSVAAMLDWAAGLYSREQCAGVLAATSICFDLSVYEIFLPLTIGGAVVLVDNAVALTADRTETTLINTVPSAIAELVRAGRIPTTVRTINLAGEPLPNDLVQRLYALPHVDKVYNLYGPSEDTTYSTWALAPKGVDAEPPIGRPIDGTRGCLADESMRAASPTEPGELCLAGLGLARGYLHRPDLTAERFIPDPFGDEPGGRMYRTGDLARPRADGQLDFLGRLDHQVKLRGFRIELGEIEAALRKGDDIREAAVLARPLGADGEKQLVAFITLEAGAAKPAAAALRDRAAHSLPEFMVPARFQILEALPLTPNGKIDRKVLQKAPLTAAVDDTPLKGPTERALAAIWREALGLPAEAPLGAHANFLEQGGHSLTALKALARVRERLGAALTPREFLQRPTLRDQAAAIDAAQDLAAASPIAATPAELAEGLPLSFSQERLWFLDRLEPESVAYHMPYAVKLIGALDEAKLRAALDDVVRRHETLRARFVERGGRPVQIVDPRDGAPFEVEDLRGLPAAARETEARRRALTEARRPFDLKRGPLFESRLYRLADREAWLLLRMHHIVSDGLSLIVIMRELSALYAAAVADRDARLAPLQAQYADFAAWSRRPDRLRELDRQLAFWTEHLADAPPALELPVDYPRPPKRTFAGGALTAPLPEGLMADLADFCRGEGATPFMALLGLYAAFLCRYSGQDRVVVGTPAAGRDRTELEPLIGFFVNTLALHFDLDGAPSLRELLAQVRETALAAYANQDAPFEQVVERLNPERDLSRSPVFQAMFALEDRAADPIAATAPMPDLALDYCDLDLDVAMFEQELAIQRRGGAWRMQWRYNRDLFRDDAAARWAAGFETLLHAALRHPDRPLEALDLLTGEDRERLLHDWNRTEADFPAAQPLTALFSAQAASAPHAPAFCFPDLEDLSGDAFFDRARLAALANQLAHRLRAAGVGPDAAVGLCARRSPELFIAMTAIFQSGGACLPLDPGHPRDRLAAMIATARPRALLIQPGVCDLPAPDGVPTIPLDLEGERWRDPELANAAETAPDWTPHPDQIAYLMFTSGSTGEPKGVAVPLRGALNRLHWAAAAYGLDAKDRFLHTAAYGFDIAVWEWLAPLSAGALALVTPPAAHGDPAALARLLVTRDVTAFHLVPSLLQLLLARPECGQARKLRLVFCGGEAVPKDLIERAARTWPKAALHQFYGPTEASINATAAACRPGDPGAAAPIGKPIANTRIYLLNGGMRPVPLGAPGELCIAGAGLARGYADRPGQTAARFVPDPFAERGTAGARLYKTGDLARWTPEGELIFVGRVDHQVKIRGFRVELGEIEAALTRLPGVRGALALALDDGLGGKRLAAYVEAAPEEPTHRPAALRRRLAEALPDYMIPAAIMALNRFPLTANGKIDRRALPEPRFERDAGAAFREPANETEKLLAAVWGDLLGLDRVGADDHFFTLGGHSLLAVQVLSRLRDLAGLDPPLRALFEHPVLSDFAARLDGLGLKREAIPRLTRETRDDAPPLSFAQERLWFLDRLDPDTPNYNVPFGLRLIGPRDNDALQRALDAVFVRHESLRTRFGLRGDRPVQIIDPPAPTALPVEDLSAASAEERAARLLEENHRPFDLALGPLARARLFVLGDADALLHFNIHHIVFDGWSTDVLFRELAALYAAEVSGIAAQLPEPPVRYRDYARWQRRLLKGETLERQMAFWERALAEAPTLELATDLPRPPKQRFEGGLAPFVLDESARAAVDALAGARGATPFMVYAAAWAALLGRYARQDDVCLGTPAANRNRAELEGMIGFFVNTLALRADLSGDPSFAELLARVRGFALDAFAHQDAPFERVVERLKPERDLSRTPLFQAMFSLETEGSEQGAGERRAGPLAMRMVKADYRIAKFDLTLTLTERGDAMDGLLTYAAALFRPDTAARMAGHFRNLLRGATARPDRPLSQIDILDRDERRRLLFEWNDTARAFPAERLLHENVSQWAARAPDAPALALGERTLSYGELDRRANQLAWRLLAAGARPDRPIAVGAARAFETAVAILAALKAGGAYLPLDPAYPEERLRFMAAEAGAEILAARAGLFPLALGLRETIAFDLDRGDLDGEREDDPNLPGDPLQTALVLFTSGTTGRPKGVALSHRGVMNLATDRTHFALQPDDCMMQIANLSFDAFTFELWLALAAGASLRFIPKETLLDANAFAAALQRHGVTAGLITTALFNQYAISKPDLLRSLRTVLFGGEKAEPHAVRAFIAGGPPQNLINAYGPTEATTYVTLHRANALPADAARVPIGAPIQNTEIHLFDPFLNPAPIGAPGELFIGGAGLARGYVNRPDLTADRFRPHPYPREKGARLYRTGDLARRLPHGEIEFIGRADRQIKLRGHRIELREIEQQLREHPRVSDAVAAVIPTAEGDRRLAAHVQIKGEGQATATELADAIRAWLAERAPAYMVPAAIVAMDRFPLTPNGKLDRKALPAPEFAPRQTAEPPRTPAETLLAGIWEATLGVGGVGAHDHFFELGGHSLVAARTLARIHDAFAVDLPLKTLFEKPVLADQARAIEAARLAGQGQTAPPLTPVERQALPGGAMLAKALSFAQERLWFLHRLEPDSPNYNIPLAYRLRGPLNLAALARALSRIVERHEALRTRFVEGDERPSQRIEPAADIALPLHDLSRLAADAREAALQQRLEADAHRSFDLHAGPVCRFDCYRLAEDDHALLVCIHHIAADGWSMEVFLRELRALYRAGDAAPDALPALPIQYADYAAWQRDWLRGPVLDKQLAFWKAQLADAPPHLELPLDFARPPVQTFNGRTIEFEAPAATAQALRKLCRAQGATPFMALLAVYAELLRRYTGQTDLCIGAPVANRGLAAIEPLIGFFVNTLVLRLDLAAESDFAGLLRQSRRVTLDAQGRAEAPFEKIVDAVQPERDLSRSPLFQTLFTLEAGAEGDRGERALNGGLELTPQALPYRVAKFELTLALRFSGDRLGGALEYNVDLFRGETMDRLIGHFLRLTAAACAEPDAPRDRLDMLADDERDRLLRRWNDTAAEFGCLNLDGFHRLFERQAAATPEAEAVRRDGASLSYADLDRRANRVAHLLRARGAGLETPIGLCMNRSIDMLTAMLGVLKAGAAYVPLDPAYPAERIASSLEDTNAPLLITESALVDRLPRTGADILAFDRLEAELAQCADRAFDPGLNPESMAYALFTSGSTGRPKGVAMAHRGVLALLGWAMTEYAPEQLRFTLAATSICFDLSVFELFLPLSVGGCVVLADNALALADMDEPVTLVNTVPSAMAELTRQNALPDTVNTVNLAGEPLRHALVQALYRLPHVRGVYNLYGPSEDTTYSTWTLTRKDAAEEPTIGRPLANTRVHLTDAHLRLAPQGCHGQLCLAGQGLARGYFGRPDLTAEKFTPDPFAAQPGQRLYQTGDLARWLPNGELQFLGRIDHQVKLRGFRIELGEIEAVLRAHERVTDCVALVRAAPSGEPTLVAYAAAPDLSGEEADRATLVEAMREALADRVPHYMIPGHFVTLPALPLTPNGKLDRKALPAPQFADAEAEAEPPQTPEELALAEIWAELLGLEPGQIGAGANFFELGGHSLLATRVASRLRRELNVDLPLRELFAQPTVRGLAARLADLERGVADEPPPRPVDRAQFPKGLPLSFSQERLWFLDRLEQGAVAYHIPVAYALDGDLDAAALKRCFDALAARHESLRTHFAEADDEPVQIVEGPRDAHLDFADLRGLPEAERDAACDRLMRAAARTPFALDAGPLLRVALYRLAARRWRLLINMHHIVSDGWSLNVLFRELGALYRAELRGEAAELPPLPLQYADFAVWQRGALRGPRLAALLDHWEERLAGAPPALELPTDHHRPTRQTFRGDHVHFEVPAEVFDSLRALARDRGATHFMTLLAAYAAFLGRYAGQGETVIGTPIANRNRAETEGLIGFFVNTLALRLDLGGDPSFAALIDRARETALDAYAHQDAPFEQVVDRVQPERDLRRTPLFQTLFSLETETAEALDAHWPGLRLRSHDFGHKIAKFELSLYFIERADGLLGSFAYNTALFRRDTAARLSAHFQRLLAAAAADPQAPLSRAPLMSQAELRRLLHGWNDTRVDYSPSASFAELFEARAAAAPDHPALFQGDRAMSYGELNARANRLAHLLRALGAGPEAKIGVALERSFDTVVSMLAAFKAGAAYLPIDPTYPPARVAYMIEDAGLRLLITREGELPFEPDAARTLYLDREAAKLDRQPAVEPTVWRDPALLAYVIYTSGSTGQPKGVGVAQASLLNHVRALGQLFGLTPDDRMLQFSSVSFDMSVRQIFPALGAGAAVVLLEGRYGLTTDEAQALIERRGVTAMVLPAAFWHQWTQDLHQRGLTPPRCLRMVNTGGEKANPAVWKLWNRLTEGRTPWHNTYGPTETTVTASWFRADPESTPRDLLEKLPIGKPIPNSRLYVLDPRLRPVPIGVAGELFIAGAGTARGYLGRPDATAEKFLPDPFVEGQSGARMYRSGDAVRFLTEGHIEFVGRVDRQIKLRGFRIELGEIEHRLRALDGVREAVVQLVGDDWRGKRIAAYAVPDEPGAISADALRRKLADDLPEYMVPASFTIMDAFPLNPSGKVDRKALPEPEAPREAEAIDFAPPQTPTQEALSMVWRQLLQSPRVGRDENFFNLGGHSLLATRAVSRIRELFGAALPLKTMFEKPTLAEQAEAIDACLREARGLIEPPLTPRPREAEAPLSFAQERMWFLNQMEPESPTYNIPKRFRLTGTLDAAALEQAFRRVAERQESLRARFLSREGQPFQIIEAAPRLDLRAIDLRGLGADARAELLERLILTESRRSFDLTRGPLLRICLFQLEAGAAELLHVTHHICSDGWSATILTRELAAFYAAEASGRTPALPDLPIQYADFAAWQREWLSGETRETQLAHWTRTLTGAPASVDLPLDHPRPPTLRDRGEEYGFRIEPATARRLAAFCEEAGVTPFMATLAAFGALIARYSNQTDLCIGTPIANRNRREIEELIGFFVNTLVLRLDLEPEQSFAEMARRARATAVEAYAHQDVPFEQVVERLQPERDLSRTPLFQVFFTASAGDAGATALRLPGLAVEPVDFSYRVSRFDLSLNVVPEGDALWAGFEYRTDLFERDTIARLARHFANLLENLTAAPEAPLGRAAMIDDSERRALIEHWNRTEESFPSRPLTAFFEDQAARTPDATALFFEDESLSYAAFAARVDSLVGLLRRRGVGPETPVGVCMTRSFDLLTALYAIVKAGGYYVPLDPELPAERLAFMTADSGVRLTLTQRENNGALGDETETLAIEDLEETPAEPRPKSHDAWLGPGQAAYMIYTSGSTGRPKGVVNGHGGIVNRLSWMRRAYPLTIRDRVVQKTPFSFDVSVWELFWPLTTGAALAVARPGGHKEPIYLSELIAARQVTAMHFVPSMLQAFVELADPARCATLERVFCSGEALPAGLAQRFLTHFPGELHNLYGPTEAAIEVTSHACRRGADGASVPIGAAISNTQIHVVDRYFEPVPISAPGELLIAGVQVARGYAGRPALTASVFTPDPFSAERGARLYRSGDLARRLPNGEIDFLGRLDAQVKIRGFRIELGEIEAALRAQAGVADAAVLAREAKPGDLRLVAFIAAAAPPEPDTLQRALEKALPAYMVPAHFVILEAMPLTPSGKLDRKALPTPDFMELARRADYVAPRNDTEAALVTIWGGLLNAPRIGVRDNFFDLGGHSLLATRLAAHIWTQLKVDVPIRSLFDHATVESQAQYIDLLRWARHDNEPDSNEMDEEIL